MASLVYYLVIAVFPFLYPFMLVYDIVRDSLKGKDIVSPTTKLVLHLCIAIIVASYLGYLAGIIIFYVLGYCIVVYEDKERLRNQNTQ